MGIFLNTYPGYKIDDVLNMPAISFYAMLNEAYRIRMSSAKLQMEVSTIPHIADRSEREQAIQQLEWASKHPGDILKPDSDSGSSPAEIKKLLGG